MRELNRLLSHSSSLSSENFSRKVDKNTTSQVLFCCVFCLLNELIEKLDLPQCRQRPAIISKNINQSIHLAVGRESEINFVNYERLIPSWGFLIAMNSFGEEIARAEAAAIPK